MSVKKYKLQKKDRSVVFHTDLGLSGLVRVVYNSGVAGSSYRENFHSHIRAREIWYEKIAGGFEYVT